MAKSNVKDENNKKTFVLVGIAIFLTIVAVMMTTYAFFTYVRAGSDDNVITAGNIKLVFEESGNNINLTNQFPTPDNEAYNIESNGGEVAVTEFTVTGNADLPYILQYKISALKGDTESGMNRFPDNQVKLYLVGTSDGKGSISIQNGYDNANASTGIYGALASVGNNGTDTANNGEILLATGQVADVETVHSYTLRMWISDSVKISDTNSNYTYCASTSECNDNRNVYNTMYYSLKLKVENIK